MAESNKQQKFRKSLIVAVHTSIKYKQFFRDNKEDYKVKLLLHFGVESSKDLSIEQLIALVDWLNHKAPELATIKDRRKEATQSQMIVIRRMWEVYANDQSDNALRNFIYKITKKRYLNLDMIARADATKCILALKNTLKEK